MQNMIITTKYIYTYSTYILNTIIAFVHTYIRMREKLVLYMHMYTVSFAIDQVTGVILTSKPVDVDNQCTVTWRVSYSLCIVYLDTTKCMLTRWIIFWFQLCTVVAYG